MQILLNWIVSSAALFITSRLVDGFEIKDFKSSMLASVLVGFLNMTLYWILVIITFPITVITLGLFLLVVNAIVLKAASGLMRNFTIKGWLPAIIGAIVVSFTNMILFTIVG